MMNGARKERMNGPGLRFQFYPRSGCDSTIISGTLSVVMFAAGFPSTGWVNA